MTDNVNISYSFQSETAPIPPNAGPLVAFADCEIVRIDESMTLVINRQNGQQQLLNPQLVDALTFCTHFRTIEQHAGWLGANRPELQGNVDIARTTLQQLDQAELLMHASNVAQRLGATKPVDVAPTRAFIITCDRPAALERLLKSMLRVGDLGNHDALVVIDDSRKLENQAANREAVATFNTRCAFAMSYLGSEAQQQLIDELISALPEHEHGIRFLLDREQWSGKTTYGRARTLSLLLSVGYRAIVMDDDILCEAYLPPIVDGGLGFGGGDRKAAFFSTLSEMQQHMAPTGFGALEGHASLLGSTLGHALHELNGGELQPSQLDGVNATLANVLDPRGRVLITQCGSWGDPGTANPHWGLTLGTDSVERLITAPHGISDALCNGTNWLGSSRPNFVKMAFMSQMTGLDNSQLLPPYFTAFRGEDLLFGAMVEYMHHNSTTLEYGWGVPHLPIEDRAKKSLRDPIAARGGGLSLFARYLADTVDYGDASNPDQKLNRMSQEAMRLSERNAANLLYDFRAELARRHVDQLHISRGQLARAESIPSASWKAYLERSIDEVINALAASHGPAENYQNDEQGSDQTAIDEFRSMAAGFGKALEGWPAIREASRLTTHDMLEAGAMKP